MREPALITRRVSLFNKVLMQHYHYSLKFLNVYTYMVQKCNYLVQDT